MTTVDGVGCPADGRSDSPITPTNHIRLWITRDIVQRWRRNNDTPAWRGMQMLALRPGGERAHRFIVITLILQRASYCAPALVHLSDQGGTAYRTPSLNLLHLIAVFTFNVFLIVELRRRGWITGTVVAMDVAMSCVSLFAVTANCMPGGELTSANWSTKYMLATGALVGAFLSPLRAALVLIIPAAAYVVAMSQSLGTLPPLVAGLNSFVWLAAIAHIMRRYLGSQERMLDVIAKRKLTAETIRIVEQVRFSERMAQHRALHDTVLTTLTAVARGTYDQQPDLLRQRCERDADYVRRLIATDTTAAAAASLGTKLAALIADVGGTAMRVHFRHDSLPAALPDPVVDAVTGACREALNNVMKHAETDQAWLTATWDKGALRVTVVDRGVGFDVDTVMTGFGLPWSVEARMREAGGGAFVSSLPADGTCVELVWPVPPERA